MSRERRAHERAASRVFAGLLLMCFCVWSTLAGPRFSICAVCAPDPTDRLQPEMVYVTLVMDWEQDGDDDLLYAGPAWNEGGFVPDEVAVRVLLNQGSNRFIEGTRAVIAGTVPTLTQPKPGPASTSMATGYRTSLSPVTASTVSRSQVRPIISCFLSRTADCKTKVQRRPETTAAH